MSFGDEDNNYNEGDRTADLNDVFGKPMRVHPYGVRIRPLDIYWIVARQKKYPGRKINFWCLGELVGLRNSGKLDPMDIDLKEWKTKEEGTKIESLLCDLAVVK